jgi:hypothetical protein
MMWGMSDPFVPFGLDDDEARQYEVLVEGVPSWLREHVLDWLLQHLTYAGTTVTEGVLSMQTTLRIPLGARAGSSEYASRFTERLRALNEADLLKVIDYTLAHRSDPRSAQGLQDVLLNGRSKYEVYQPQQYQFRLRNRVAAGVQDIVEGVMSREGEPGQVLARAWMELLGLEPNPSEAYRQAVKAVEIAAIAVVQPNKQDATLGTVIGQMAADANWGVGLREDSRSPIGVTLVGMMRLLWHGQEDRHGRAADNVEVSQEQARTAVVLAATLLDWFASGAIKRRPATA